MITAKHYYELHITVEAGDSYGTFEKFRQCCVNEARFEWKASRFAEDDVDGMNNQWFCSLRLKEMDRVYLAMNDMQLLLSISGYNILRMKAEDTLFDTKYGDKL